MAINFCVIVVLVAGVVRTLLDQGNVELDILGEFNFNVLSLSLPPYACTSIRCVHNSFQIHYV